MKRLRQCPLTGVSPAGKAILNRAQSKGDIFDGLGVSKTDCISWCDRWVLAGRNPAFNFVDRNCLEKHGCMLGLVQEGLSQAWSIVFPTLACFCNIISRRPV